MPDLEGYAPLGKVGITPKGNWIIGVGYQKLDVVSHNGNVYVALKDNAVEPEGDGDGVNWELWLENVPIATTKITGKSKPDGRTITIDTDGTLHGASQVPEGVTYVNLDESEVLGEPLPINADTVNGLSFSVTADNKLRVSWKEITD